MNYPGQFHLQLYRLLVFDDIVENTTIILYRYKPIIMIIGYCYLYPSIRTVYILLSIYDKLLKCGK